MTPRRFSTQPDVAPQMRFQGSDWRGGGRKGVQPEVQQAQKPKDACRFHQYERPAVHVRGERSEPVGAGIRMQDREQRISGDAHGRSSIADYHERYAHVAAGSSLPGEAGAASRSPVMTSRGGTSPLCETRRVGACDPRGGFDLTPSARANTECRYHTPGTPRQGTRAPDRMSLGTPRGGAAAAPTSPRLSMRGGAALMPTAPSLASPSRTEQYRDLLESKAARRPADSTQDGPARMLSAGGAANMAKRRLNESHVAAARQTSSPIAAPDGVWA